MESESDKAPAPGALALVQAFVNTLDLETRKDELDSPGSLNAWLRGHGLLERGGPLGEEDLQRAREAREALRALLLANNGEEIDGRAVATLNRVAAEARLAVQFGPAGQSQLEPATVGIDGALGRLLAIVHAAELEGTWARLKACRSHTCQWAFYDSSKNRSGAWCNMAECGCRSKARAYRQRRRAATATAGRS